MMRFTVLDEREAAVERQLKPLVAICRPRIGQVTTSEGIAMRGASVHPQPERAIDVNPCASGVSQSTGFLERIRGTGGEVPSHQAEHRRNIRYLIKRDFESVEVDPPVRIQPDQLESIRPDAEKPDGADQ